MSRVVFRRSVQPIRSRHAVPPAMMVVRAKIIAKAEGPLRAALNAACAGRWVQVGPVSRSRLGSGPFEQRTIIFKDQESLTLARLWIDDISDIEVIDISDPHRRHAALKIPESTWRYGHGRTRSNQECWTELPWESEDERATKNRAADEAFEAWVAPSRAATQATKDALDAYKAKLASWKMDVD